MYKYILDIVIKYRINIRWCEYNTNSAESKVLRKKSMEYTSMKIDRKFRKINHKNSKMIIIYKKI